MIKRRYPRLHFALLGVALFFATSLGAFTLNRNDAHIKWRSFETEHFIFNYPAELEPIAGYIAGIAESVAEEKMQRYHIRLPNKVEFVVREDIFSNGWANSLQNTMTVWISDWDFPIRSTHNWLKDVVTHEFSHLVSIQSSSKLPSPIQGLVFGYQGYFNAQVQPGFATIIPFTEQPNWFAEGVAQYESEFSGYDAWDSHRDMILRTAALEGKLLSYDRMGTFAGTSIQYEQGPYTQGFAFVKWIAEKYGDGALIKLWAENSRIQRQTLSASMQRILGKDAYTLWEDWKNSITAKYSEQMKSLGPLHAGQKLTTEGFYNYYPRWDSKGEGIFFVSNRGRDDFKGSLYRYNLADTAVMKVGKDSIPDKDGKKKKEEDRLKLVSGSIRSPFDVMKDDSTFLYHNAREEDKNGIHKLDIFQKNPLRKKGFIKGLLSFEKDQTKKRFTKNLNAVQASYDHEGKRIVFVRNYLTNFYLCTAPVPEIRNSKTGKIELNADSVKTLFPTDTALQGKYGFNIYSPRFSPDGEQILFSYYDGTSRNIGMVNSDGSNFHAVLSRPYDERDPEWSVDGKSFYFSADSSGIYNLYECELATGNLKPLTQVSGGAFAPAVDPLGKHLAYAGFDSSGFSLYLLDLKGEVKTPSVALKTLHPGNEKVEAIDFEGKSEPYIGIPNRYILNPLLFGEEMSSRDHSAKIGEAKWLAGFNGEINDPILKNEVSGALLLEVGNGLDYFGANDEILSANKESQFYLALTNHSLPVSLGVSFSRGNLTSRDTIFTTGADLVVASKKKEIEHYAIIFRNAELAADYNLFDATLSDNGSQASYLGFAGGYSWNDFNFFESQFAFNYYKNIYLSSMVNFYGQKYSDKEPVAPQGLAAAIGYNYNLSSIFRGGSFAETFDFSNGVITPLFRNYTLQDFDAGLTYGLALPWADNGALVVSAFAGSILDWKYTNNKGIDDTLDSFFSKGMYLRGYPYLRDIENLTFQGENTAKASADLNQPIISDIYKSYWILFIEDLYVDLFYEAGRTWNGSFGDPKLFEADYWHPDQHPDSWYQSFGWGLKLNAKIYHNYPFLAYFEAATAVSGIPNGKGGIEQIENVTIPIGRNTHINTYATRISFGVSFGLYNGLLGKNVAHNPYRPESPFAKTH